MRTMGVLLLSGWALLAVGAEGALRDPTRPPDVLAEAAAEGTAGEGQALRLEAVLRPLGRRPVATINGETVGLGGEVRGMRLVAIRETEVVLQGPEGARDVLRMAPAVEKTMARSPQGQKKGGRHDQ